MRIDNKYAIVRNFNEFRISNVSPAQELLQSILTFKILYFVTVDEILIQLLMIPVI